MKKPWIVAATAVGAFIASSAWAQTAGIEIGAEAPGAAVETLTGEAVNLAAFMGDGPVVLEFWATWCPLCRALEPSMAEARREYEGRVTFVSVGVPQNQSPARQMAYAEAHDIGGEFVFDRDRSAIEAYSAPHTSYVVIVDADGRVAYTGVGEDQDIPAALAEILGTGMD